MALTEDLQRLDRLHDSGKLTAEQHRTEKARLLAACVNRIENWSQKPRSHRVSPRVIRGTVSYLGFSDLNRKATLRLDGQRVTLNRPQRPISMTNGDQVLVVGNLHSGVFAGSFYINESNGDNSVDESRETIRRTMVGGGAGVLGGLAIVGTAVIAALREPTLLSAGAIPRIGLYLVSIAAGLAVGALSFFILAASAFLYELLRMIDREHLKGD